MRRKTVVATLMLLFAMSRRVGAHGLIEFSGNPDVDAVIDLFGPILIFGLFWGMLELRWRLAKAKAGKLARKREVDVQ